MVDPTTVDIGKKYTAGATGVADKIATGNLYAQLYDLDPTQLALYEIAMRDTSIVDGKIRNVLSRILECNPDDPNFKPRVDQLSKDSKEKLLDLVHFASLEEKQKALRDLASPGSAVRIEELIQTALRDLLQSGFNPKDPNFALEFQKRADALGILSQDNSCTAPLREQIKEITKDLKDLKEAFDRFFGSLQIVLPTRFPPQPPAIKSGLQYQIHLSSNTGELEWQVKEIRDERVQGPKGITESSRNLADLKRVNSYLKSELHSRLALLQSTSLKQDATALRLEEGYLQDALNDNEAKLAQAEGLLGIAQNSDFKNLV